MSRRMEIEGRTAFITGAARGIGAEVARRLHRRGANVALVGLEPHRLEGLAAELGEERTAVFEVDVTDLGALERAVAGTVERFGGIDIGVANAGVAFVGTVAHGPIEHFERTIEVNLLGVYRTDRAVLPQITERGGYLLNIASMAAASHAPLMSAYTAAKAGVEAMTDALRVELHSTGARAGCAYFGFIDTDMVRGSFEHPAAQASLALVPKFLRTPVPVSRAGDVIEKGIERRKARVWAPRFVGPALLLRGVIQPLTEITSARAPQLRRGITLADDEAIAREHQDDLLGVAAEVLDDAPSPADPEPVRTP